MKIAVIGSRNFNDYILLSEVLDAYFNKIDVIISGRAIGADTLAEKYANKNNIKTIIHKPDWDKYGKSAGFIRNKLIIDDCDIVIAFWDGKSKGTNHSIELAKKLNKHVKIINYGESIFTI